MFRFGGHCHLEVNTMSLLASSFLGCVDTEDGETGLIECPGLLVPKYTEDSQYKHKCQEMDEILFRQLPKINGYHFGLVRLSAIYRNQIIY